MRKSTKHSAIAASLTVIAVGCASVAWAYWSAAGNGQATASATEAVKLTTIATTSAGTMLFPGGRGDLKINIRNENPYPVQISTVIADGQIASDHRHEAAGCAGSNVTFDSPQFSSLEVGAKSTREFRISNVVEMAPGAPDACQGATFTIPVLLIGGSNP